ncbi:hypothetical protein KU6B_30680 [Mameliella alba]|uniref:hypothetical protein n=1 Tax=Mameliella alba TaxID=561184 RepID=UPI0013E44A24|nr:hypothetical protein [Mameliella alba]BBU56803.1 hypothetical protein KU6B_30680 [Mameliella alba]
MKNFAKIAFAALALTATSAAAGQGDKITAMGYGHSQQQAKIVTIQTWTAAAHESYGYADWNTAYVGQMECVQNYAKSTNEITTFSREVIRVGGDQSAPWSCIVSGYQDVKTGYNGGYDGYKPAKGYGHKAPAYGSHKKVPTLGYGSGYAGHAGGYTGGYSGGYGGSAYKY